MKVESIISGTFRFFFMGLLSLAVASILSCSPENVEDGPSDPGKDDPEEPVPEEPSSPLSESLMMDVVFHRDGTAEDVSENANAVRSSLGSTVLVYYNNAFEGYVPRFYNTPGEEVLNSGFYKAEYLADRSFKSEMQEGFTLETMFVPDSEPDGNRMSVFSSVEDGGTGLSVLGDEIVFELYTGTEPSPKGVTLKSGTVPEKGKAYHVVGVWDKESETARLYVNGELKSSFGTSGDFVLPENPVNQWFGIGCDAGTSSRGQYPFRGDVFIARVYGQPADDAQVSSLWAEADKGVDASVVSIDDIMLFPTCEVEPGYRYMVLGTGFQDGDLMKMVPVSDMDSPVELETDVYDGHISISIPDGITTGDYSFYVVRSGVEAPLGVARLELAENPAPLSAPGVIAHRGYHTLPGVAENSIAALKASQELGIYGCEIDVWITTDGYLVIHHDGVLSGKTLQNCTYGEIKDLKLSNGETLPLLGDMLEQTRTGGDTKLIIEIKEHDTAERNALVTDAVVKMVEDMEMGDHVEYICFDRDVCRRIASASPDAMVGYLMGDTEPAGLAEEGIMCIDYPFATLNTYRYMVSDAHDLGMKVNIWTVNSDADMLSSIALGVDYITTDYPGRLMEIYRMMEE